MQLSCIHQLRHILTTGQLFSSISNIIIFSNCTMFGHLTNHIQVFLDILILKRKISTVIDPQTDRFDSFLGEKSVLCPVCKVDVFWWIFIHSPGYVLIYNQVVKDAYCNTKRTFCCLFYFHVLIRYCLLKLCISMKLFLFVQYVTIPLMKWKEGECSINVLQKVIVMNDRLSALLV